MQECLSKFAQGKNDPSAVSKAFNTVIETCKDPSIDIAQLLPCAFVVYALAAITHEYGHVAMTNILCNVKKRTEVYVGRKSSSPPLFSIGHLHFMQLPLIRGDFSNDSARLRNGLKIYEGLCKGISAGFGGISAATFLYACIKAICTYCAYVDGKKFPNITLKNIFTGFGPFQTIVQTKALSNRQKRFLLNLTFVMCTALSFQMIYGGFEVLCTLFSSKTAEKLYLLVQLTTAISDCIIFKKYYDARQQLLHPNPVELQPVST
ncbi:MAG: hypothetical protein WCW33_00605 [Candidatus Babeliales bacterium]